MGTTTTYRVLGMSCAHCERAVRAELRKVEGVTEVDVDAEAGTAVVHSDRPVDVGAVAAAIDEAGYELAS